MPGRLIPLALNPMVLETIPLIRPVTLIGRHPGGDVCLPYPCISRRHCCIIEADQRWYVRDLWSKHGVWVNGQLVHEHSLRPGDEVALGPLFFMFTVDGRGRDV